MRNKCRNIFMGGYVCMFEPLQILSVFGNENESWLIYLTFPKLDKSKAAFTRQTKVGKLVLANSSWCVWTAQKQSANTFYLSPTVCQRVCRLFLRRSHTPAWVCQHEFANFSLPCEGCLTLPVNTFHGSKGNCLKFDPDMLNCFTL